MPPPLLSHSAAAVGDKLYFDTSADCVLLRYISLCAEIAEDSFLPALLNLLQLIFNYRDLICMFHILKTFTHTHTHILN